MQPNEITSSRSRFRFLRKVLLWSALGIVLLLGTAAAVVYIKKDALIAQLLQQANQGYKGLVAIDKAELYPFRKFPYISVELTGVRLYETKKVDTVALVDAAHVYAGFNLWRLLRSDYHVQQLKLEDAVFNLVQYESGEWNLLKALEPITVAEASSADQPFTLDLRSIELNNIDVKKMNAATGILFETDIKEAVVSFKKTPDSIKLQADGVFMLNVFRNSKPTYVYHKNLELHTDVLYHKQSQVLAFKETTVVLEGAAFDMEGQIDIDDEMNVDLHFSGKKPDFNLLIGFAPEELIPVLRSYDNRGNVYFDAQVKGKTANNQTPAINAVFGCKDGYIKNKEANKVLDQLGFHCTFTNGAQRNAASSVFELKDFTARPEAGRFKAGLKIINLEEPEIDLQLDSDFDLVFLTRFFKLRDLSNLTGQVLLTMNFHDIIDLQHPEKALEKLNQAYFSRLSIKNLNFRSDSYHLPIRDLNVDASIKGEALELTRCSFLLGDNDLSINGTVSNIPAVLHKTSDLIRADLHVKSARMDLKSFYPPGKEQPPTDEVLSDVQFDLAFRGRANTFLVSRSLPVGNYYITNVSTRLQHYRHSLNGWNGVVYINERDMLIKRLDGRVDASDVHLEGKIGHYDLWLAENKQGDTEIAVNLTSKALHFKDIFTYKGKNYIPEEYRNEDLKDLKLNGRVVLHYDSTLQSADCNVTELQAQLKLHPLRLHSVRGKAHFENGVFSLSACSGNLGNNDFLVSGTFYMGSATAVHQLRIQSQRINVNELITWNPPAAGTNVDHTTGTNIFAAPFPNLSVQANINELTYQKYQLKQITGRVIVQANHFISLDKLQFVAAGGLVQLSGYFNGSNPAKVYLNPDIKLQRVDLDQLFFKFDNFGQDQLVSENIHGLFTGRITGKILLHPDFTPIIQSSELQMDVLIENGRLDRFAPMQAMSAYFGNKNLDRIRFDTLQNRFTLKNGWLSFPNMTVNSSLGYLEISGSQSVDLQMDYYVRVPLKVVGRAAFSKLFNRKPKEISAEQEDELIIRDPRRRTRFINIRITGRPDDFNMSLQKSKDVKAGVQFTKTDDFLFDDIESEFEEQ